MNSLKPGDKVKFLNASGGGVVTRIIDHRTVSVMIEEGFEIPTMVSELIRIDRVEPAARFFEESYKVPKRSEEDDEEEETEEPADDRISPLPSSVTRSRKSEDIYLAFVPQDQKWLITGPVDVWLVNNSSFDVLYNIFTRTPLGHYAGADYGSIFPDSKLLVASLNLEQLSHWTEGCLQFLFHKEQSEKVLPPFNSEFSIEGKKFHKEGSYREHPVVRARAIVVKLLSLSDFLLPGSSEAEPAAKGAGGERPLIDRHRVAPREAVVDLHIHELVEDPVNLEGSEILDFQRNYFLKCLDSARANHYRKVVFIHGIGNGILRAVLTDLLKKQEGIEFFDAPLALYGAGAIDVRLPHNG